MLMKLGDDNTVAVACHGLADMSQGYLMDALYSPIYQLSSSPSTN